MHPVNVKACAAIHAYFCCSFVCFWSRRSFCWLSSCAWRCYWPVCSALHCRVSCDLSNRHSLHFTSFLYSVILYTSILTRLPLPLCQCARAAGWCLSGWAVPWFMSCTQRPAVCTSAGCPFEPPPWCCRGCHRDRTWSWSKSRSGRSW